MARALIKPGPSDDETAVLPRGGVMCQIRLENFFSHPYIPVLFDERQHGITG